MDALFFFIAFLFNVATHCGEMDGVKGLTFNLRPDLQTAFRDFPIYLAFVMECIDFPRTVGGGMAMTIIFSTRHKTKSEEEIEIPTQAVKMLLIEIQRTTRVSK